MKSGFSSLFSAIAVFWYPPTHVLTMMRSLSKSRKDQRSSLISKERLTRQYELIWGRRDAAKMVIATRDPGAFCNVADTQLCDASGVMTCWRLMGGLLSRSPTGSAACQLHQLWPRHIDPKKDLIHTMHCECFCYDPIRLLERDFRASGPK